MTRSLKKGPFVASYVMEKVEAMNASGKKKNMRKKEKFVKILEDRKSVV